MQDQAKPAARPTSRADIINTKRACETVENGSGARCACTFDCVNYWLRALGFNDPKKCQCGEMLYFARNDQDGQLWACAAGHEKILTAEQAAAR